MEKPQIWLTNKKLACMSNKFKKWKFKKGIKGLKTTKGYVRGIKSYMQTTTSAATMQNTSKKTRQWESWNLREKRFIKDFACTFFYFAIDTF